MNLNIHINPKLIFMLHKSFIIILSVFALGACTINEVGPPGQDGVSDKQIRLPLGINVSTSAADSVRVESRYDLIKFDKRNYVFVDSIVFVSALKSKVDMDTCLVQLYNVTDRRIIQKATLTSDTTAWVWKESLNIFADLPAKEVSLGVIVRNKKTGAIVEGGQSFLFLYRE
jgi:hypothetical protein